MRKIITVVMAVMTLMTGVVSAFDDVSQTAYETEILQLKEWGYINGYEDNTFKPEQNLTRAEFCRMLVKAMYPMEESFDIILSDLFSDLDSMHWASTDIYVLHASNVINGFTDGTFRPEDNLTVAQAINMCLKATGYSHYVNSETIPWYKGAEEVAKVYGFAEGTELLPIVSDRSITRAEMAKLLYNTINMPLVLVTGWEMSAKGEPTATTEIADGKDGRELRTLLSINENIEDN